MIKDERQISRQALARILDYCAQEAQDQRMPGVEDLIRSAIKELDAQGAGTVGKQIASALEQTRKR